MATSTGRQPQLSTSDHNVSAMPGGDKYKSAPKVMLGRRTAFATLYCGYLMMYIKRSSFDTCIPTLLADPSAPVGPDEMARMLSYGSLAYGIAKAVAGSVCDVFGGSNTLSVALVASGVVLTSLIGFGRNIGSMTVGWVLARALSTGPYPALCSLAREWWPDSHGAAVGVLATASRAGSMLGAVIFTRLLDVGYQWRNILQWTGLAVSASGFATKVLLQNSHALRRPRNFEEDRKATPSLPDAKETSLLSPWAALTYFVRIGRIWLGTCALCFICPSFELASLIPVYMRDMGWPHFAALAASVFQVAAMASMTVIGLIYDGTRASLRPWLFAGKTCKLFIRVFRLIGLR